MKVGNWERGYEYLVTFSMREFLAETFRKGKKSHAHVFC